MQPLSPTFGRLYDGLRNSHALEKMAAAASPADALELLMQKAALDNHTFELAKEAGLLDGVKGVAQRAWQHPLGRAAGIGAAGAAGAAIPATMAVNAMSDHATDQMRNKALQTGVGLAGIGASLYGLHRATTQAKTAAEEEQWVTDALHKLASVGYLDEMLTAALSDTQASDDAKKLAAEVRSLNREFGVEVLRNLMG